MKTTIAAIMGLLLLSSVLLAGNADENSGLQFKEWGISFTVPAQWQRSPTTNESALAAQYQQALEAEQFQITHLASWRNIAEKAALVLTVTRKRSSDPFRVQDILEWYDRDNKRGLASGKATKINRHALGKIAGRDCVVSDVSMRDGSRMLTYAFVSVSEKVELQWLFIDPSRFAQLQPAVDGVLKSLSVLSSVELAGNADKNSGLQFKEWGISFTVPAQWRRMPSAKETVFGEQFQQNTDQQLVHIAAWSTADEKTVMVLTVSRWRSGRVSRMSELLAEEQSEDKQQTAKGFCTRVNRCEISKVSGRDCVINDVNLQGGGRMITNTFVSGSDEVKFTWMFRDASRYAQLKTAIDGVLQNLLIGNAQK